jgi:hypothetical protein
VLGALDDRAVDRVADVEDREPERPDARATQRPSRMVRGVLQLARGREHALPRLGAHPERRVLVEQARHH